MGTNEPASSMRPDAVLASPGTTSAFSLVVRPHARAWRDAFLRRLLAIADAAAAFVGSLTLGIGLGHDVGQLTRALLYLPVWLVVAKLCGLYERDQRALRHLTVDDAPMILLAAVASTFGLAAFIALTAGPRMTLEAGARVALVAASTALALRGFARLVWRAATPPERIAIVGNGVQANAVRRKLELFSDIHADVVCECPDLHVDDLVDGLPADLGDSDRLVVASATVDDAVVRRLVELGRAEGVKISVIPEVSGLFGTAVQLNHVADLPIVEYKTWHVSRSTLFLKRILDVGISSLLLLVLSPLMAMVAIAIKLDSRGPVFFGQLRAGLQGRPFRMLKFRTMIPDAEHHLAELICFDTLEQPVFKIENDPRVTRLGRLLRRWSLDELPQLVNVVRGEMSLVGPRPEQLDLVERYSHTDRFRLDVKPGITGPMQVYGRGALRFDERLAVERDYIENLSIGRDLRLLAMTVAVVIRGNGAV